MTQSKTILAPVAARKPQTFTAHGDTRTDEYFWLREKTSPEVIAYLEAENAYMKEATRASEPLQEKLYQEMIGRIVETDQDVPYPYGAHLYYTRTEKGLQYPIYCRKLRATEGVGTDSAAAPEEVLLDLNELAKAQKFLQLGDSEVSDDGFLLAYSCDYNGFRDYELFIKDLRTGELLPDRIGLVAGIEWSADGRYLYYVREDDAKRSYRLFRHELGHDVATDVLLYEEADDLLNLGIYRSEDRKTLLVVSDGYVTTDVRYLNLDHPTDGLTQFMPKREGMRYFISPHGRDFWIRMNDQGPNFRLMLARNQTHDSAQWEVILPHRPTVMLSGLSFFRNHVVFHERENGLTHAYVRDLRTGRQTEVPVDESVYTISPSANRDFESTRFRYVYQSLTTPRKTMEYDMVTGAITVLKVTQIPGGYDPTQYQAERIFATAADGTRIPISLAYRKDLHTAGKPGPLYMTGYGAYGISYDPSFSTSRLSLLDRGVTFAIAHIRGGGDLGKEWHNQGRMLHKKNTFTDFIAVSEYLQAQGHTSKDLLVVEGGSAGGLLMGAVTNLRPDLFKAVISEVPFVDVINTMSDETLPLTKPEYQEWGNPAIEEEYRYMRSYSPYDNLEAKAYPNILVVTSLNDSQVMYWEPAKYVARLRTLKRDETSLLMKINMEAGHGGASGRYEAFRELAFIFTYVLSQLGLGG